jgi:membrane-associated protease RseP (regulator of RpoE activity)
LNQLMRIANPVIVFLLICLFIYTYFFYLKGGNTTFVAQPKVEKERAWEGAPQERQNTEMQLERQGQDNAAETVPAVSPQNPQNPVLQPNQNVALPQPIAVPDKILQEGHWIGLEVIPLTPAIAKANSLPPEVEGVLIDEVTLLSAEAGLLAGDVIVAVNGKKVSDLKSFQMATKDVAQSNRASVSVYRGGKNKDIMVFSTEFLGVAQMEAAPMILATDKSPHGRYGPCDKCHTISKTPLNTGQLAKDQGDVLTRVAPNIRRGTPAPHRKRGTCTLCHVVL